MVAVCIWSDCVQRKSRGINKKISTHTHTHTENEWVLFVRLSTKEVMLSNCGAGCAWTARSNQPILKEISPEYSLEGLLLKLKLQYFGHLMQRIDSLGKTLMLGKIEGRRRRGWQRMRWLDGITELMVRSLSKLWEIVEGRKAHVPSSMGSQRVGHNSATEQ